MHGRGKKDCEDRPAGCRPKDTQRRRGSTTPEESTPDEGSWTFSINWKKFTENIHNYTDRIPSFRRPWSSSASHTPHSVVQSLSTPSSAAFAEPGFLERAKQRFFPDSGKGNEKQIILLSSLDPGEYMFHKYLIGEERGKKCVSLLQKVTKSLSSAGSKLYRSGTDMLNKLRSESKSEPSSEHAEQRHSSLPIHLDPVPARRERRQSQPVRQMQQSHESLRSPNLPSASGALFLGPSTSARCEILRETPGTSSGSEHRKSLPIFEKIRKRPGRSLSEYSEVVDRRHNIDLHSSGLGFNGCESDERRVLSRRNFQFCGLPPKRVKSSSGSSSDDRSSLSSRQKYPLRRQNAIDEENPPAPSLQDINTRGFSEELVRRPPKKKQTEAHYAS